MSDESEEMKLIEAQLKDQTQATQKLRDRLEQMKRAEADKKLEPLKATAARAPVSVQEAAKVLLGNRAVLDRMVDVAEDINLSGVSFNRVVGDALRAIAEGGEA